MNTRKSIFFALVVVGFFIGAATTDACERVLLLVDADTDGTTSLVEALVGAGHEVVEVYPEHTWDGSNPSPAGFDVVIHLNGPTFHTPLPVDAQLALVEFVRSGGGFVGEQFNGFELAQGRQVDMADLVLQSWPNPDNCAECIMEWSVVPVEEEHPVLKKIPASFIFFADAHDAGPLVEFDADLSTVLMTSLAGGPAVIVREFEKGRVVSFSCATNTSTALTLQDTNIQQLFLNATAWAAAAGVPATIEGLLDAVDDLVDAGILRHSQGVVLRANLRIAQRQLDRGHTEIAINALWRFVFRLEGLIRSGELSEEDGEPLVDAARTLIGELTGP